MKMLVKLWSKIHEPRVVSVAYFLTYFSLFTGGVSSLVYPQQTIIGELGFAAMYALSAMLTFGGALGMVAALPGIWWLERIAVLSISMATTIYAVVVLILHINSEGNRLLQLSFIVVVGLLQLVRWVRIRERPYDPDKVPPSTERSGSWTQER